MNPSPTWNFTPPKVCLPVGKEARLLSGYLAEWKLSFSLWLTWGFKSRKRGPVVFGAGAAGANAVTRKQTPVRARRRDIKHPPFAGPSCAGRLLTCECTTSRLSCPGLPAGGGASRPDAGVQRLVLDHPALDGAAAQGALQHVPRLLQDAARGGVVGERQGVEPAQAERAEGVVRQ